MKVLGLVVAMLLVVTSGAWAIGAGIDNSMNNEQGQAQGQAQGQGQLQGQDQSMCQGQSQMSKSESSAGAVSGAAAIQGQSISDKNKQSVTVEGDSTNIDARERAIRWVNVQAPNLPSTQGKNEIVAATPFGSIGAAAETTIARQGAYANAILAGKELIPNADKLYGENLEAMKKTSKPRWGIITQLMKLIY
jgi:hypothetical protein